MTKSSIKKEYQEELKELNFQPLVCQICGFSSAISLISHIIRKHKIKMEEYRDKFPNFCVQRQTPRMREKNKLAQLEWHKIPENHAKCLETRGYLPNEIDYWLEKGFTNEETKDKISEHQKRMSRKGNNPISLAKKRIASKGDNNPMSLVSIATRHNVSIEEASKLTPAYGRVGELHPMFGKHHTQEALEKIASSPMFQKPTWRSRFEIEIYNFCKLQNDETLCNQKIGKWNVDILIKSKMLIIEHFGTWWHMWPGKYQSTDIHKVTGSKAIEVWTRDTKKISDLAAQGYNVLIIWEHDWKNNRVNEVTRIINAIN